MTYRQISAVLARYIGILSFDPAANANSNNRRGLGDQDIADLVACINGAQEEVYSLAPSYWTERETGGALRPSTTITGSFTQYGTACVLSGHSAWMTGCTVRIGTDAEDNRLVSATELARPYMGSTGSGVTVTVFADCLTLPATYNQVIEPVRLTGLAPLKVLFSREEFDRWCLDRSTSPRDLNANYQVSNRQVGEPRVVLVEQVSLGSAAPAIYLRFNPMPAQAYGVTFTAKLAPPVVVAANIWTEATPTVDPGVSPYFPDAESILLPFCLQRWTAHPSFSADGQQLTEISRQYKTARETLLRKRGPVVARQQATYLD